MEKVGLALGSNLGDRIDILQKASKLLVDNLESRHCLASGVYETAPLDCPPGSPSFYNAVIELETDLPPLELLTVCQDIEQRLGRPLQHEFNAPRTVDIDILYYGEESVTTDRLTVPHPRMEARAFVQLPLSEIRPDLAELDSLSDIHLCQRLEHPLFP